MKIKQYSLKILYTWKAPGDASRIYTKASCMIVLVVALLQEIVILLVVEAINEDEYNVSLYIVEVQKINAHSLIL